MTIDDVKLSEEGRFLPWGKVAAEKLQKVEDWIASGGGNPNRVETITGTLGEPWGDIDTDELYTALFNGYATAEMVVDGGEGITIKCSACATVDNEEKEILFYFFDSGYDFDGGYPNAIGSSVGYYESTIEGEKYYMDKATAYSWTGGIINLAVIGYNFPTTLTIIWHPLPESES